MMGIVMLETVEPTRSTIKRNKWHLFGFYSSVSFLQDFQPKFYNQLSFLPKCNVPCPFDPRLSNHPNSIIIDEYHGLWGF